MKAKFIKFQGKIKKFNKDHLCVRHKTISFLQQSSFYDRRNFLAD